VPGCLEGQDPEDAPPSRYSMRYRLCGTHLYADGLRLTPVRARGPTRENLARCTRLTYRSAQGGELLRHCQKCSVLHPVGAFEGAKRSCRAQLERQRARRAARAAGATATTDTPPSGGTPTRRSPETASPTHTPRTALPTGGSSEDGSGSGVADAAGAPADAVLAQLALWDPVTAALLAPLAGGDLYYGHATSAITPPPVAVADCEDVLALAASWLQEDRVAAMAASSSPCVDVRIKLPAAAPQSLPQSLHAALLALLDPATAGAHAAVCPGCTLITLGGVEPPRRVGGRSVEASRTAAGVVRQLLSGPAGRFFRAQPGFSVALGPGGCDAAASERGGRVVASVEPLPPQLRPPPLPPLPLAACSAVEARLAVQLPPGTADSGLYRLRCRVHGQFLLGARLESASNGRHVIVLPISGACGLALLELEPVVAPESLAASRVHGGGVCTAIVLTPDAAVAKELASEPLPASADAAAERDALAACVGHALRGGSKAPPRLARAAARACIARGWLAAAAAVLPGYPADGPEDADDVAVDGQSDDEAMMLTASAASGKGAPSLLHLALSSPVPLEAAQLVLTALRPAAAASDSAAAWGVEGRAAPRVTPMHLAASMEQPQLAAQLLQLLLARCPGVAAAAWAAADGAGCVTPAAALAAARHPRSAELKALAATLRADVALAARTVALAVADARDAPRRRLRLRALPPAAALDAAQESLDLARDAPIAAALAARAASAASARARRSAWRLPGSFPDPAMEADWLRHVARIMRFSDMMGYPFAALSHGAQLLSLYLRSGALPTSMQAFYFLFMTLLVPTLILTAPAFFTRRREAVHAFMRVAGALMLPAWVQRPGDAVSILISPVQQAMTLFGMAFFSLAAVVRAPLHAALQATTFAITIAGFGITAHMRLRITVAVINLLLVAAMERASRRRFQAAWGARAGKSD
jgi:hypothetical protein